MEEEEKSMWDRRADGVAIITVTGGKRSYTYLSSSARQTKERTLRRKQPSWQCGLNNNTSEDVVGSLTEVGREMGQQWAVKLLTFVGGTCGSVHKEHLEKNLEEPRGSKS